jgi:hypothetical protein
LDTIEVIEAELQAVLNNDPYARKGTTSKGMVAGRPKVVFD